MAIAEIKQGAGYIHGQIKSIADRDFWGVHVAAEFRRHDRTARFSIGRRDTDTAQKRMKRNFHFVAGIECLKCGRALCVVNRVKPDLLRQRLLFQHWSVMRGVDGAEAR